LATSSAKTEGGRLGFGASAPLSAPFDDAENAQG
jgi:hypothetical protein